MKITAKEFVKIKSKHTLFGKQPTIYDGKILEWNTKQMGRTKGKITKELVALFRMTTS